MSHCRMIGYHFLPQPARCLGPARDAANVGVKQTGFTSHCTPLFKHILHAIGPEQTPLLLSM